MRGKEAELTSMKRLVCARVANEVVEHEATAVMFHFNPKTKRRPTIQDLFFNKASESNPSMDLSSITLTSSVCMFYRTQSKLTAE